MILPQTLGGTPPKGPILPDPRRVSCHLMRGWVATTDFDWYAFLRGRDLEEVNFWQPKDTRPLRTIGPGEPFFFKLKSPHNAIAGFGIFARHSALPAWLAWDAFEEGNGATDFDAMRRRIEKYRRGEPRDPSGQYKIGCNMIVSPIFFGEDQWVEQPRDWRPNIVQGSTYDLTTGEGLRVWRECQARASSGEARALPDGDGGRYGEPILVQPRLGQGTFRIAVIEAYGGGCAVTTEHSLPVLDAAHIKPFADGGPHEIQNGMLVRSDIHRLFDRGYVTVTPDCIFQVGRRLKQDYDNGRSYQELHGKILRIPSSAEHRPNPALLRWHNENRFLG